LTEQKLLPHVGYVLKVDRSSGIVRLWEGQNFKHYSCSCPKETKLSSKRN